MSRFDKTIENFSTKENQGYVAHIKMQYETVDGRSRERNLQVTVLPLEKEHWREVIQKQIYEALAQDGVFIRRYKRAFANAEDMEELESLDVDIDISELG